MKMHKQKSGHRQDSTVKINLLSNVQTMSDSQWLVEFVLGLLNSVLNLPVGPVKFFGGIQITKVL